MSLAVKRSSCAALAGLAIALVVPVRVTPPGRQAAAMPLERPRYVKSSFGMPFIKVGATSYRLALRSYDVLLHQGGVQFSLPGKDKRTVIDLRFIGSRDASPEGADPAPIHVNVVKGRNASSKRLATVSRVRYRDLWPGIDLIYESGERLKYSFVVAPGADPSLIRLAYSGARSIRLGPDGELHVRAGASGFRDAAPVASQRGGTGRTSVRVAFRLAPSSFGFRVGRYDSTRALLIDPEILEWSGRPLGEGVPAGVAVDSAGNAYVAMSACAPAPGACDPDVALARISSDGSTIDYLTYLGGSEYEIPYAVAVTSAAEPVLVGFTVSSDFPVTANAFDTSFGGDEDAFVTKLAEDGATRVYSTYLGGSGLDRATAVALDVSDRITFAGWSESTDFPTKGPTPNDVPFQWLLRGSRDVTTGRIDPADSGSDSLEFSTYFGGDVTEEGRAVAVDPHGNTIVGGITSSTSTFPLWHPVDSTGSLQQGFVFSLNASGSERNYATFLGGDGYGSVNGLATDTSGNAYATGYTPGGFPTTPGVVQQSCGACFYPMGFATKLNHAGDMLWSTYIGGSQGPTSGTAVSVDASRRVYLTGATTAKDFPTTLKAFDKSCGDNGSCDGGANGSHDDAFVTVLPTEANYLLWSSFLGGGLQDEAHGLAVHGPGVIYIAGMTYSDDFPLTGEPWDQASTSDFFPSPFATKLNISADVAVEVTDHPDPVKSGAWVAYRIDVVNHGPMDANVLLTDAISSKAKFEVTDVHLFGPPGGCGINADKASVTCQIPTIKPSNKAAVLVRVHVISSPPSGTSLFDEATAIHPEPDPNPSNNIDHEVTTVNP